MIELSPITVSAGTRLPYDVVDRAGRLLLLRGEGVGDDRQAASLRETGFRPLRSSKFGNAYSGMARIADGLARLEKNLAAGVQLEQWQHQAATLARDLMEAVDLNPDAAFAGVHLDIAHSYLVVHHMMAGVLSARLGLACGLDHAARHSLTAAAITHDIGIIAVRREIDDAQGLSDELRRRMHDHPQESVRLLREFGVQDALWLDTVGGHHEYLDGSGYLGRRGKQIGACTRIVALADAYSAMLRPRPYRERVLANAALEQLYTEETGRYDPRLIEHLIWDFGLYPPGSLIRLANRELAVVICNTPGILDNPRVAALTDSRGRPLVKPYLRDTRRAEFAIVEALDPSLAARAARQLDLCWAHNATLTPKG